MANVDSPRGLSPIQTKQGGPPRLVKYTKDNSASAIYIGDAVKLEADGYVAAAAAGNALLGVAGNFSTASKTDSVWVYDDPDTVFSVQDDGAAVASAQTHVGNNADVVAGTGDVDSKLSGHELDISGVTTGSAQLRVLGLHKVVGNAWGSWARIAVQINEHQLKQTTGV